MKLVRLGNINYVYVNYIFYYRKRDYIKVTLKILLKRILSKRM